MALIQIEHLDFDYGGQAVLKHIDLTVPDGSTVGVIGPNGGGKTTLMKLLLGLIEPTRGSILIDGVRPREATQRGDVVGYLPQNPRVPGHFPMNVRQVVRLGLVGKTGMLRAFKRGDTDFADHLIERVGLVDLAETPVGSLSGGQLQRVFIARALAARPKVLLLDEPTTGIDASGQQRFVEFLEELKKELGLTVVLVSHDLRSVAAVADRIACLNVTLHYHDVPERMPRELAASMFGCDLEAMGISRGHACGDPGCCEHVDHGAVVFTPVTGRVIR
ncbi:MAG TPA: metal ABC transporter ATP-binding protein [Tepidisphaeraceae bacterium]|nr:metal ABC transporter ATP-binding protein [Tepidisphaeraceae bacterium]